MSVSAKDFAKRTLEGFEVKHYSEVDKSLREGAKEVMDFYIESVGETVEQMKELANA